MAKLRELQLVMLGPAVDSRCEAAAVIDAYRRQGLFKRWAVDYLATYCEGGVRRNVCVALIAWCRLIGQLVAQPRAVVHVHTTVQRFWHGATFMVLGFAARCPMVLQLHGGGFRRMCEDGGPLTRWLIRFFLERAACVLVPCESMRAWIVGIAKRSQVVCLRGPVSSAFAPDNARRQHLVLFLSDLDPSNGIFDLLEAVAGVRAELPDVRLVCAGEGERSAVLRYAERLGIADAVTFTGWVGPSGKRALFESAAVFALPVYDEGLPIALLEAMAAGMPVLGSPVGGIPEMVADGFTGFLTAPGDVRSVQRLLRKLLCDAQLSARVGAAGRASVRSRCAPERVLPRLEALYARLGLLGRGEAGAPAGPVDLNGAA